MPEEQLNSIVQLATQGLFSIVFLVLYMQERKAHEETRKELYEVLREIAGLRISLTTQSSTATEPTRRNFSNLKERAAANRAVKEE